MAHLQKIYLITLYPKTAAVAREVDDNFQKIASFLLVALKRLTRRGRFDKIKKET
jgi:hypothetical protein